jgi:hypothetical protein
MSLTNCPRNHDGLGLGSNLPKSSYHDSALPSFKPPNVITPQVESSADLMDES